MSEKSRLARMWGAPAAAEPPLYTISRGEDGRVTVTTTPAAAEPVAWKFHMDGVDQVMLDEDADIHIRRNGIPLFAHPAPPPSDRVREVIERMEGSSLPPSEDTPAQLAEYLASGARLVEAFHQLPGVARAMREAAALLRELGGMR